jgi:predicted peptidase
MDNLRSMLLLILPTALVVLAASHVRQDPRPGAAPARADHATGFLFRSITVEGREHRYAVYVPREYDASTPWPLIVSLNGAGECGTDGSKQLAVGLGTAVMLDGARWPFVVLFPQKPDAASAWEDHDAVVMAMLDRTRAELAIDASRVYLTGLSQGGHGAWTLAARHPRVFAAVAPVCGYGDAAALAPALKGVPVWAFHGDADRTVPVAETHRMVEALRGAGAQPRVTIYAGVDHNSWDRAYRQEKLAEWFLEHRRAAE